MGLRITGLKKRDRLALLVERKPLPPADDERRYQFVQQPRCPDCSSTDAIFDGTSTSADGEVITRVAVCLLCGASWLVVAE